MVQLGWWQLKPRGKDVLEKPQMVNLAGCGLDVDFEKSWTRT